MGNTLYLECESGISGDMVVGALIDLGVSTEKLGHALSSLGVDGYEVCVSTKELRGIAACDFDVIVDDAHQNHDHDMSYLFGSDHDEHIHAHEHSQTHEHHHEHRSLTDVSSIINNSALTNRAKSWALRIFDILAQAESKAHGVAKEEVHFHEVGAVDSIVDIVACAFCLDELDVSDAVVSPLLEGTGEVRTAHGMLPIPVPAVAHIVADHGLVLSLSERKGEFVTPTGAAIAAAIQTIDKLPKHMRILKLGVGSGKRAYNPPSMLRAMLIEDAEQNVHPSRGAENSPETQSVWKLETEVDDCTGEALAHTLNLLLDAGAFEAHFIPVIMKKSRPGYQLEVICSKNDIPALESLIFENTTTIGIRRYPYERSVLKRKSVQLETRYGSCEAKCVVLPSGEERIYPEYESVAAIAREHRLSYQEAFAAAIATAHTL